MNDVKVAIVGGRGLGSLTGILTQHLKAHLALIKMIKFEMSQPFSHINKTVFRDYDPIPPKKLQCSGRRRGRRYRGS